MGPIRRGTLSVGLVAVTTNNALMPARTLRCLCDEVLRSEAEQFEALWRCEAKPSNQVTQNVTELGSKESNPE